MRRRRRATTRRRSASSAAARARAAQYAQHYAAQVAAQQAAVQAEQAALEKAARAERGKLTPIEKTLNKFIERKEALQQAGKTYLESANVFHQEAYSYYKPFETEYLAITVENIEQRLPMDIILHGMFKDKKINSLIMDFGFTVFLVELYLESLNKLSPMINQLEIDFRSITLFISQNPGKKVATAKQFKILSKSMKDLKKELETYKEPLDVITSQIEKNKAKYALMKRMGQLNFPQLHP